MLIVKSHGKLPVERQTKVPLLEIILDRCQKIYRNTFNNDVVTAFMILHIMMILNAKYLIVTGGH